jgi:hypothetical protein
MWGLPADSGKWLLASWGGIDFFSPSISIIQSIVADKETQ